MPQFQIARDEYNRPALVIRQLSLRVPTLLLLARAAAIPHLLWAVSVVGDDKQDLLKRQHSRDSKF